MSLRKTKIQVFIGTRPECIKLAPLVAEIESRPDEYELSVCLTSQHREMLQQALKWFPIQVHHDLDVMSDGQHLIDLQARIMTKAKPLIESFKPDWVVVQGDTATALSVSLAATWLDAPVAHVEAGLRTGNRYSPWPEELNRTLIGRLARCHLAPTGKNAQALEKEGVDGEIHVVGNTVIDALLGMQKRLQTDTVLNTAIASSLKDEGVVLDDRKLLLVTGHRRESFGDGFRQICAAIARTAREWPEVHIVYAVHLNPQVHDVVHELLSSYNNVSLIGPQDYASFVYLMDQCHFILSDSGGIQEEAPSLNKPVLVMRDTTERTEAIDSGSVKLVGTKEADICDGVNALLNDENQYNAMAHSENPFGRGITSALIADILLQPV
ncbi:MAG: non-hydrolyzing UDP-N-acetylglucosamine 2-epimerase [Granulosicoccus sp.]